MMAPLLQHVQEGFCIFKNHSLELSFCRKMEEIVNYLFFWCYEEHKTSVFAKNNLYQFISTESIIMD